MVHKRRGNPNWGKPLPTPAVVATEFEGVALRLGLTKETYSSSGQLRIWCERNGNRCYVPEWLLKEWGIMPDVGWSCCRWGVSLRFFFSLGGGWGRQVCHFLI